jgi:hypothetical protein
MDYKWNFSQEWNIQIFSKIFRSFFPKYNTYFQVILLAISHVFNNSRTGTLIASDINIETPFLASARATAWGVLTITTPVIGKVHYRR